MTGAGATTVQRRAGAGGTCPHPPFQVEKADARSCGSSGRASPRWSQTTPLGAIAERWRELTMPEGEGDRAVLQSRLDAVRGRIVDLEEARYVEASSPPPMTSHGGTG